ncbi:MAG: TetR/AcrR family transcriptional regulator [bacterium]
MTPDKTKRSRTELREDLLDSSNQILQEEGLENFSLNRAADGADTSKQMIYTLFGSKNDLIKAVYDRKIKYFVEDLPNRDIEDPIERLRNFAFAYRNFIRDNFALFDMMMSLSFAKTFKDRNERVVERNEIFDFFDEAIQEAIDEGYLPERLDVESVTDSLWSAANGCLRLELVGFFDSEETAREHYIMTCGDVLWGRATVEPDERQP